MSVFSDEVGREAQEAAARSEELRARARTLAAVLSVATIVGVVAVVGAAIAAISSPSSGGLITLLVVGGVVGIGLMALTPFDARRKTAKREADLLADVATHLPSFYRDPEPLSLCDSCGHHLLRVAGRCPGCGARLRAAASRRPSWEARTEGARRARRRAFAIMSATPCGGCGAPVDGGSAQCGECGAATGFQATLAPVRRLLVCGGCRTVEVRGSVACPHCHAPRALVDLGSCGACGASVDKQRIASHLRAAHAGTWAAVAAGEAGQAVAAGEAGQAVAVGEGQPRSPRT